MRMGSNIVAYVTSPENLEDKLNVRKVISTDKEDKIDRGFLQIAKLKLAPHENIQRIGHALVNVFEIQHQIYRKRPSLAPSFLKESLSRRGVARPHATEKNCSFCGKHEGKGVRLVAGPKVFICGECVGLCNDILGKRPSGSGG